MNDEELRRIARDAKEQADANAALMYRMKSMEAEIAEIQTELAEYRGWKKNGFIAAIGLAGLVLAQPFLRFWEKVIGQ